MFQANFSAGVIVGLALVGASGPAAAEQDFRIDFVGFSKSCIRVIFCFNSPIDPFSGSFTLPDTALATDGSVDILATIDLGRLRLFDNIAGASHSSSAVAFVVGGTVVDVDLQYTGSYSNPTPPLGTTSSDVSFRALAGSWTQDQFTFNSGIPTSSSSSLFGTYTVTAVVPEPATWLLWLAGVAALPLVRRSGRYSAADASAADPGRASRPRADS